jgi:hypothetical protein
MVTFGSAGRSSTTSCPDVLVGFGFGHACPMTLDVEAAPEGWVTGPVAHD